MIEDASKTDGHHQPEKTGLAGHLPSCYAITKEEDDAPIRL